MLVQLSKDNNFSWLAPLCGQKISDVRIHNREDLRTACAVWTGPENLIINEMTAQALQQYLGRGGVLAETYLNTISQIQKEESQSQKRCQKLAAISSSLKSLYKDKNYNNDSQQATVRQDNGVRVDIVVSVHDQRITRLDRILDKMIETQQFIWKFGADSLLIAAMTGNCFAINKMQYNDEELLQTGVREEKTQQAAGQLLSPLSLALMHKNDRFAALYIKKLFESKELSELSKTAVENILWNEQYDFGVRNTIEEVLSSSDMPLTVAMLAIVGKEKFFRHFDIFREDCQRFIIMWPQIERALLNRADDSLFTAYDGYVLWQTIKHQTNISNFITFSPEFEIRSLLAIDISNASLEQQREIVSWLRQNPNRCERYFSDLIDSSDEFDALDFARMLLNFGGLDCLPKLFKVLVSKSAPGNEHVCAAYDIFKIIFSSDASLEQKQEIVSWLRQNPNRCERYFSDLIDSSDEFDALDFARMLFNFGGLEDCLPKLFKVLVSKSAPGNEHVCAAYHIFKKIFSSDASLEQKLCPLTKSKLLRAFVIETDFKISFDAPSNRLPPFLRIFKIDESNIDSCAPICELLELGKGADAEGKIITLLRKSQVLLQYAKDNGYWRAVELLAKRAEIESDNGYIQESLQSFLGAPAASEAVIDNGLIQFLLRQTELAIVRFAKPAPEQNKYATQLFQQYRLALADKLSSTLSRQAPEISSQIELIISRLSRLGYQVQDDQPSVLGSNLFSSSSSSSLALFAAEGDADDLPLLQANRRQQHDRIKQSSAATHNSFCLSLPISPFLNWMVTFRKREDQTKLCYALELTTKISLGLALGAGVAMLLGKVALSVAVLGAVMALTVQLLTACISAYARTGIAPHGAPGHPKIAQLNQG